ncbi:hypothetical protein HYU21_03220, partial [Candidatus Woesearchaeota archaeon]|nr:hypothetical protein [Candidatus Woesearchaeota archaeon]
GVTAEVTVQPSAATLTSELPRFLTFELTRFPPDLTNLYEVTFTNTSTSSFGGTSTVSLKVCSFDVQDVNVVTVCDALSGKKLFALEAAKPKRTKTIIDDVNLRTDLTDAARTEILGRIGGLDTNLLFLYNKQVGTTPKMVHVYRLDDLTPGTAPAGPQTKEGTMFSNNLVGGRSYGFMVQDEGVEEYYLLSHPPRPFDDLNDLTITALSNPKLPRPLPQADDERAIFILPAERFADVTGEDKRLIRFTVKRIQTPEAQYEVSADTDFDNKVDLAEQLETAIDTYSSVELMGENPLGKITLSSDDDALAKEEMVININSASNSKRLVLAEPQVDSQTLFYYKTFYENKDEERKQTYHTKQAEIFKLYQLGASGSYQIQTHPITDEAFYIPLLRGRRLALSVDGNYYLLKHNERWKSDDKLTFFKREAMTLTLLGETEKDIEGKYSKTTQEVTFNLEKAGKSGEIKLHFNTVDLNNQQAEFYFVPKSEETIIEFDPVKEYRAELPARTSPIVSKLQLKEVVYAEDGTVSTTIPGNNYRNCDEPDIDAGITNFMLFCTEEDGEETTEELTIGDFLEVENTVVTYRGKVGGKKQVVFQYVLGDGVDLSQNSAEITEISWRELTTNIIAKKNPAIKLGDRYFEIDGSSFSALTFRNISAAKESFGPISVLSTVEGANTGRIAIGTNLYKLEQSLVDYKITLSIRKEQEELLGTAGITLAVNDNPTTIEETNFISSINKEEVYAISASLEPGSSDRGEFVRVKIIDTATNDIIYSFKIPQGQRRPVLLSNGDLINVDVNLETPTDSTSRLIIKITK